MKGNSSGSDSFLYGSGAPQSDSHEPRFESAKPKSKKTNVKTSENKINKAK
jgi:hypothetical protein